MAERSNSLAEHACWLERRASELSRSSELARDLVQETFVAYLKRPPTIEHSLRSWLEAVMRNHYRMWCRTSKRRQQREFSSEKIDDSESLDDALDRPRVSKLLLTELEQLQEPYRTTLRLRYYENLQPSQIAHRLGLPHSTVRRRNMVGLQLLRARLLARFDNREKQLEAALLRSATPLLLKASPGDPAPAVARKNRLASQPRFKTYLLITATIATVMTWIATAPTAPDDTVSGGAQSAIAEASEPPLATPFVTSKVTRSTRGFPANALPVGNILPRFQIDPWIRATAPIDDDDDQAPARRPNPRAALPDLSCGSLQRRIDEAPPGATIQVPPCIFRETIRIDKPLALLGEAGSEVRGSDQFVAWTRAGTLWRSEREVPELADLHCTPTPPGENSNEVVCWDFEQVFVDGKPLRRAPPGVEPKAGEFSLDASRRILLPSSPHGHTVEVTVRRDWGSITANDVTIRGLQFRHAFAGPSEPAFQIHCTASRVHIEGNVFERSAGPGVVVCGTDHVFVGNRITGSGGVGLTLTNTHRALVEGNYLEENGLGHRPDNGWVTGGISLIMSSAALRGNQIVRNPGIGITVIGGEDVRIERNRLGHNGGAGIITYFSRGGHIAHNTLWHNGRQYAHPGMFVTQTRDLRVTGNTLIFHDRGVEVNVRDFDELPEGFEACQASSYNRVEDNTFIASAGVFMTGDPRPVRELPACPTNIAIANRMFTDARAPEARALVATIENLSGLGDVEHAF